MRTLFSLICSLCLFTSMVLGQSKGTIQWNCGKPSDTHSIDVGDQAGHAYVISTFSCTAAKGELDGVKYKDGIATEFEEARGGSVMFHGVYVATMANGDKAYFHYEGKGSNRDGAVQSSDSWTTIGGTGKFKAAKAKGTCKGKGDQDGSVVDCTEE